MTDQERVDHEHSEAHSAAWLEQCRLFPDPNSEMQPGPMLPEICLMVRASMDGSADPWTRKTLEDTRTMLVCRVATWDKGRGDTIDECVNKMCRAAIILIDDELTGRTRDGFNY